MYENFNFGLSLQTYAQTFSALAAFFVGEMELRENLIATHRQLARTNAELQLEEKKVKAALEEERRMDGILREKQEQLAMALAAQQVSNGVKYNKTGGMLVLRIRQEKSAPAGYATYHFVVKDTGIGMSEEFQKHIFETFTREETTTVSGIQGTGLGMAITKKSVEMMGGHHPDRQYGRRRQ